MDNSASCRLNGHSGCIVERIYLPQKSRFIVRKTSGDVGYNERLAAQMEKQKNFKSDIIKAPHILNFGYTDSGLFYFEMEYVKGQTFSEYIKIHNSKDSIFVVSKLLRLGGSLPGEKIVNDASIQSKLCSLERPLSNFDDTSPCKQALSFLKSFTFTTIPCFCHGDLTFENVIVTDNADIYLIDFLDSFNSSYEVDISKLMQDAMCHWSYRNEILGNETLVKLDDIKKFIVNTYKKITGADAPMQLYAMLLLTLLRIYPYARDKETVDFLNQKTSELLEVVRKGE